MYKKIADCLEKMLDCLHVEEWEAGHAEAKHVLESRADLLEKLEAIYKNRNRYAGYIVRQIAGNLMLKGSGGAESNNSSVSAHLGKGQNWSTMQQLSALLDRQDQLCRKRAGQKAKYATVRDHYKSTFLNEREAEDDRIAHRLLSGRMHDMTKTSAKMARRLECEAFEPKHGYPDGGHVVRPKPGKEGIAWIKSVNAYFVHQFFGASNVYSGTKFTGTFNFPERMQNRELFL